MIRTARRFARWAWLSILVLPVLAPAPARAADDAPAAEEPDVVVSLEPELGQAYPLFVIPGVRDSATAATAFHCSNPTATQVIFSLDVYGPTGTFLCGFSGSLAAGNTLTMTTRLTALFVENASCDSKGVIPVDKGQARMSISEPVGIVCTAQIVDPANATPTYLGSLEVFRR